MAEGDLTYTNARKHNVMTLARGHQDKGHIHRDGGPGQWAVALLHLAVYQVMARYSV